MRDPDDAAPPASRRVAVSFGEQHDSGDECQHGVGDRGRCESPVAEDDFGHYARPPIGKMYSGRWVAGASKMSRTRSSRKAPIETVAKPSDSACR